MLMVFEITITQLMNLLNILVKYLLILALMISPTKSFLSACSGDHWNRSSYDIDCISVELVDKCMRDLEKGKACGPDGLCSETLLFAHPNYICSLLCYLFRSTVLPRYVLGNFWVGLRVHLVSLEMMLCAILNEVFVTSFIMTFVFNSKNFLHSY